jgi:ribosomal-protein-alanine N-acetyltransferase
MVIREVKLADLDAISKIYESEMSPLTGEEEPMLADKYLKLLKANAKKSKMFVLDENGIRGFMWYEKDNGELNLEDIFVVERGKGYGRKLINHLLCEAKKGKVTKINLDVNTKNLRAISFFKKLGFSTNSLGMSMNLD